MTNRARPTWPDGAGSAKKSPGTPPGANGNGQPTPPTTPASNGRTPASNGGSGSNAKGSRGSNGKSGQARPSAPPGQDSGSNLQPRPAPPSTQPNQAAKPVRPPQQPPVRPVVKQAPPTPTATPRPGQAGPSTPQRPESRLPGQTPTTKAQAGQAPNTALSAAPTYGQYDKSSSTTETIGDRVSAAKQAVLGKAAAVKEAATQATGAKSSQGDAATGVKPVAKPVARDSSRPRTRKARLRLSRLDPWSVMKTAFLLSIAFGIVTWVAVFIVWSAIGAAGVFTNIDNTVNQVLGSPSAEPFRIENYINTGKVMGFTTLLACADVLIITALATLGSFLYNIAATLLGGLEVTLASED
jgi:hypothetical protein